MDTLPYAEGTSCDQEKGCLLDIRTKVIDDILSWIKSANHKEKAEIYHLCGVAAAGPTPLPIAVMMKGFAPMYNVRNLNSTLVLIILY